MLQRFKENILRKKLLEVIAKNKRVDGLSAKKIKSVGIICLDEFSSKLNLAKEIERILEVKNVKIYSFKKFHKKDEISKIHFTEKDINFNGQFTQTDFKNFLEQPLDLLIGYFSKNNIFLESAIVQSKAVFKVGFSNVNEDLYNIEISEDAHNLIGFTTELKKYLQILKKL